MNPRDFQRLAMELLKGNRPVDFRTAISRSYYAAYNVALEILEGMGFTFPKGPEGHGQVRYHLHNSGDEDVEAVGSKLNDLQARRIEADYHLQKISVENRKTAQALVEQANSMIETIDRSCAGPKREEIIKAIKEYKKKISPTPSSRE